jgi:hypothetical protein
VTTRRQPYATPFADVLRGLTPVELESFRESIRDHGNTIYSPITVYQSERHGPAIIDGHHRYQLSQEMGIDCPVVDLGVIPDATAKVLARQLNTARRQLSYQEWQELNAADKAERVKRVAEKRGEGKSLRTIADEEGVSDQTVRNDLKTAGAKGFAPEPDSGIVTGKDGKQYSASKPVGVFDTHEIPFDEDSEESPEPVSEQDVTPNSSGAEVQSEQSPTPPKPFYPPPKSGKAPPPRPEYPEPYATLMDGLTDLSTKFTRFINSDESEKFREFIGSCKLGWVNYTRAKIRNGKKTNPQWVAFQAVRALLRAAYKNRKIKTKKQLIDLMEEEGGDLLDIHDDAEVPANG